MSLLDEARKLEQAVVKRLKELEPLIREYDQVRKLGERLGVKYAPEPADEDAPAPAAKPAAARAGRGRAAKTAAKPRGARSTRARKSADTAKAKAASATATPSRAKRAGAGRRTGGRSAPTRSGQRNDDVLRLVRENPGITVREIGERLGVDATGLYRVAKRLTDDGSVRKDGTRLYPAEAATAGAATDESDAGAASGSTVEPGGQAATPSLPAKETPTTGGN